MLRRPLLLPALSAWLAVLAAACGDGDGSTALAPVPSPPPPAPISPPGNDDALIVGLVVKTDRNPFFVTIREAAERRATELGVELRAFAGDYDGDAASQVAAVRELIGLGAAGLLITPSDPAALTPAVREAREAGILVVALDTPFDPAEVADATFATDNFRAGELIGRWAAARLGAAAETARIVTLDGSGAGITVEVLRNQGFLRGFGIEIRDADRLYDEDDPRIVGSGPSLGTREGGRAALEELLGRNPEVNVVYAINEPAAAGAWEALQALGAEEGVLLVSVDGGCPGVRAVAAGQLGATSMQFPVRMATLGVEAVVAFARDGARPENTPGLDFHDTGVTLVTADPAAGIPSMTAAEGLLECWE